MTSYRWSIVPQQPELAGRLAAETGISPLLAQCLLNRGIDEPHSIRQFLEPRLKQLADPFLLPQMDTAVTRLWEARDRREPLVIFGDYDVDGVTSTALLSDALSSLGWTVHTYLPHRMDEGYGLSQDAVENCLKTFDVPLLLAVDCGSTAVETIAWMNEHGTDAIILDHHQVTDPPPEPVALVNPQLLGDAQPNFQELCSVGLAFKLVHALVKQGRRLKDPAACEYDLKPLLDLVALGTIADLVPLRGENRILVPAGLRRLETTIRPGLVALKEVAQVREPIGRYEVGFQIAPRLNAAGRMETAEASLKLLLEDDMIEAHNLAEGLDAQNRERQSIDRGIAEEVIGAVKAQFDPENDRVIVQGQMYWHIGVVGIVASRVVREYHRPTIILGGEGNEWRGSGRSIEGFDLAAALRECDDLLLRHGGHAMAAGLSIHADNVDALRERLNEIARKRIRPEDLRPLLRLDAEITLGELTLERMEELTRLEPTGQGNDPIQLSSRAIRLAEPPRRFGAGERHLRLRVTDGSATQEVLWWNGDESRLPSGAMDIACEPRLNVFRGRRSVQLRLIDIRPAK